MEQIVNGHGARQGREIDKQGIVVIFPRGEAIRNIAYSGALDKLNEDLGVYLLTVDPGPEFRKFLEPRCTEIGPLVESRDPWIVRIQREIIDTAHNRWLWSQAAKERSRLRDLEARTVRQRVIRQVKKCTSYPFANSVGLNLLSNLERASSRIFSTAETYVDLFEDIKPKLLFNASHVHSRNALHAVQAAQWLGIPTATFVFSWDNLTSQGRITLPYDYFLVWNDALKDQLTGMYRWIDPEKVFVTGTPQFDHHFDQQFYVDRDTFCDQIGADAARPLVLYTTGMPNHMPGEPEIVEGIADILLQYEVENRPQLMVRVYAKDQTGRFEDLRERRRDILFADPKWEPKWLTPKYEDSYSLVNSLRHCSLGINVASTVSLELCMFDKPVINVGYNPLSVQNEELSYADYYEFDHYKPVVESGAVHVASDIDEMRGLIEDSLKRPEVRGTQRRALIERMFGPTLDGKSGLRVAQTLSRLALN